MNLNDIIAGVSITKACSVSPDKDSDEHKKINITVKFDGVKLQSVFDKAVSGAVIAWQNGVGRKAFDTLKDNQTVTIQFAAPASRTAVDPEVAMIAKLQSMTPTERVAYIKELEAKATK